MERWSGKVAVVTGASSGIGAQVAVDLAKAGLIVIGLARRLDRVQALKDNLKNARGQLHAYQCDVSQIESIKSAFAWIENEFGGVNILINNAGIGRRTSILTENNEEDLAAVINTNLLGLVYCTKEAYRMLKKNDAEGHIININSVAGHYISSKDDVLRYMNLYPPSKFAVTATTEMLRRELNIEKNRKVRVTSISPAVTKTEIFQTTLVEYIDIIDTIPHLTVDDLSAAIFYVLGAPQHVSVHEMILRATGSS